MPRVGQGWGACDPNNPKNRRRRCSLLVEQIDGDGRRTTVLVDTSPDLREQLLDADVKSLDGVLYTHAHADHTHGIDDLRPLMLHMGRRIDIYADAPTAELLKARFGYCFSTPVGSEYPPILNEHRIAADKPVTIAGEGGSIVALPFTQDHGNERTLGLPPRRPGLFLRRERHTGTEPARACRARRLDSRCVAPPAASEPFQP